MKYVTLVEDRGTDGFTVASWVLDGKLPYEQAIEVVRAFAESEKMPFDPDGLVWDENTCEGYYCFMEEGISLDITPHMVLAPDRYKVELEREFAQHS